MASYNDRLVAAGVWRVSPEYPFAAVVPLVRLSCPHHGASVSRCTTASPRLWRKPASGRSKGTRQHGGMYCSHGKYPFMN